MKRLMNIMAIAVTGLFLASQAGLAQHSEHHKGDKADTTKSVAGSAMMPMQQQMMGGNATAPRGMMRSGDDQSQGMMQGKGMMGGKSMMQGKGMMGGKSMMQGKGMMGGKSMMQGGMHGKGMMQGGMHGKGMMDGGMMGMSDPVIQTLHNSGCPGFLLMSAKELELTDAQKEKLEALKLDWKKTSVKINADIDVAKIELKESLAATNPDFGAIGKTSEKIGAKEQELRSGFIKTVVAARNVLSPEQLEKVKDLSASCCNGKMGMTMGK